MKALILAGGLGTRLRGVLSDRPKPMAPVGGRPFLEYLIAQLVQHGIEDIVLSTCHLAQSIRTHFGDGSTHGARVSYSHESEPRGTGGAIKLAERILGDQSFLVMNGDSFFAADLVRLIGEHERVGAVATLALARVPDVSRYGSVELGPGGTIVSFVEKGTGSGAGLINGGIYVMSPRVLDAIPNATLPVSLEKDVFPKFFGPGFIGVAFDGFFVDIGTPDDYQRVLNNPAWLASPRLAPHS